MQPDPKSIPARLPALLSGSMHLSLARNWFVALLHPSRQAGPSVRGPVLNPIY